MADIAAEPRRAGVSRVPRTDDIWVYEIRHSRHRLPRAQRIRDPWHKILYRLRANGDVDILAIIGRS